MHARVSRGVRRFGSILEYDRWKGTLSKMNPSESTGSDPRDIALARMKRVAAAVQWLKYHWDSPAPLPDDVSLAAQLGQLIDYRPEQLPALVKAFDARLGKLAAEVDRSHARADVKARFARMLDAAGIR